MPAIQLPLRTELQSYELVDLKQNNPVRAKETYVNRTTENYDSLTEPYPAPIEEAVPFMLDALIDTYRLYENQLIDFYLLPKITDSVSVMMQQLSNTGLLSNYKVECNANNNTVGNLEDGDINLHIIFSGKDTANFYALTVVL